MRAMHTINCHAAKPKVCHVAESDHIWLQDEDTEGRVLVAFHLGMPGSAALARSLARQLDAAADAVEAYQATQRPAIVTVPSEEF